MNEQALPIDTDDAAWVSFKTPLQAHQLIDFCQDVDRLLRINPYLEFIQWQKLADDRFHMEALNTSSQPAITLNFNITVEALDDGVRLHYNQGIKSSTTFRVVAESDGSQLTIIDAYDAVSPSEREQRLDEVDKSLIKWAEDIQQFLLRWRRWSGLSLWRWYIKRVWLPMKPAARRITYMLLWISMAEVFLIILVAAIYASTS